MSNLNKKTEIVNSPIRFELVDEPEKTVGDVILNNISELFACKRCKVVLLSQCGELCNYCIDDIVNGVGE